MYVGESNDVFKRTRQHYEAAKNKDTWQNGFFNKDSILYIIGHEHFNKSLTLDVENKLILYLMSTSNINHVRLTNSRGNPQNSYYPVEELDDIFSKIWKSLRKKKSTLFPSENEVKDSAIYKASPLHKLTPEQLNAKELILHKVKMALEKNERGQLIFVDGEAGTGKTVLNSSTFYELFCGEIKNDDDFSAYLLVNHDEQISVYTEIATTYLAMSHTVSIVALPSISNVSRISSAFSLIFLSSFILSAIAHIFSQSNCFV